jgi:hypothetical protein
MTTEEPAAQAAGTLHRALRMRHLVTLSIGGTVGSGRLGSDSTPMSDDDHFIEPPDMSTVASRRAGGPALRVPFRTRQHRLT